MSFRIELRNEAGVLEVRTADSEDATRIAVIDLVAELAYFRHGDTIVIIEEDT